MLKFFRIYGLSCVATLIVLYLSISTKAPDNCDIPRFEGMDKVVHAILYLFLSLAISRDFYRQSVPFPSMKMIVWVIILPVVYGGLIEILQGTFFYPRTAEWGDWFADILGVFIAYLLALKMYPKFVKQENCVTPPQTQKK